MSTNYAQFLRSLLSPLGVYTWRPGSFSLADISAAGGALDRLSGELDALWRECMADSAEDAGLSLRGALFPFLPAGLSGAALRRAALALGTVGDASFTGEALCAALAGCGLPAVVRETDRPQTVRVEFPGTVGIPENFDRIRPVIEEILPAHVEIEYLFNFAPWTAWEARNPTWRVWDALGESWKARETAI